MIHSSPLGDVPIPDIALTPYVLERAQALGDKPALIDGPTGRIVTYAQLDDSVRRLAGGLLAAGMSKGEVLSLLDGLSGQNMVTVDLDGWRQKLLTSPWVADAAIRRVLPGTVMVVISERQPMAIGRIGDQLYLLDQRGSVIDEYGPNYAEFDLPIIDGLAASANAGGLLID